MTTKTNFKIPRMNPITRPGARLLMWLLSRYEIVGRENFPPAPFVIISNHMSYFDAIASAAAAPGNIPVLAAKKYQGKFIGFLMQSLIAPIWIEQASPDLTAIKHALAVIKAGIPLAIAPEGTRSKTKALRQALDGAAFLIRKANVPVLPVGIAGTDRLLKTWRPHVVINVGKAHCLPDVKRVTKEILKEDTERLMCAIAAMLPESYHGFYAGNPLIEEMKALVR